MQRDQPLLIIFVFLRMNAIKLLSGKLAARGLSSGSAAPGLLELELRLEHLAKVCLKQPDKLELMYEIRRPELMYEIRRPDLMYEIRSAPFKTSIMTVGAIASILALIEGYNTWTNYHRGQARAGLLRPRVAEGQAHAMTASIAVSPAVS